MSAPRRPLSPRAARSNRGRRVAVVASVGALAATAVAVQAQSSEAVSARTSCTVDLGYLAGTTTAAYSTTFVVTNRTPFTDDRSTPTREEVFSASLAGGVVTIDWFKDVSVFDNVGFSTSAALLGGRASTSGSHQFSTSSTGNHTTTYTLTCTRV